MFWVAERAVALADTNLFSVFACPGVHVPKYVSVDALIMLFGQLAGWHRFVESLSGDCCLEAVERPLRAQIAAVPKNVRSGIAVGIVCAVIHRPNGKLSRIFL